MHCFEQGCRKKGTHRARIVVRAERGYPVDIMAQLTIPAVFCGDHATAEDLSARATMPREHRRQIARDLERRFGGIPIDWDRSVIEFRHRWLAWIWRLS